MKNKLVFIIGALLLLIPLSACNGKTATKSDTNGQTKTVKKVTKTDRLLNKFSKKVSEDAGTRTNGGETTYSQFFKKSGHWNWKLSSSARGTIATGRVISVVPTSKSKAELPAYSLSMKDGSGKKYELSLKYLDFSGVGYSVKTDYLSISGNYLTCDTATSGKWITGAPDDVQGKWSTDFYRSSSFKDSPYVKTTLNIDGSSIGESNDMYNAQYKMTAEGANVGINSGLSYKKIGNNKYVLKSYLGNDDQPNSTPMIYQVKVLNSGKLKVYDYPESETLHPYSSVEKNADSEYSKQYNSQTSSSETSKSNGSDTTHLSKSDVKDWVWQHMDDTIIGKNNNGFEESDYYFDMAKDNDGNLVIDVRENHSTQNMKDAGADPSSTPRIGTFRINGKGYLQVQSDDGLHYRTVATVYGQ